MRIQIAFAVLFLAAPVSAEFSDAQKLEIEKLIGVIDNGVNASKRIAKHVSRELGVSVPQNVAAFGKISDGVGKVHSALILLLDLKLCGTRAACVASAFTSLDAALVDLRAGEVMAGQLVVVCTSQCGDLTGARDILKGGIARLEGFNRTLDYLPDPKPKEVLDFPGTMRTRAAPIPPHGRWLNWGSGLSLAGANGIAAAKQAMAALLQKEALAPFDGSSTLYQEHNASTVVLIAAQAAGLIAGIEYGSAIKADVSKIFAGMATTRTRQFARGMRATEMMLAGAADDSLRDVFDRLPTRGLNYIWTSQCFDLVRKIRAGRPAVRATAANVATWCANEDDASARAQCLSDAAALTADQDVISDLMSSLESTCNGWTQSDSAAFNLMVLGYFTAVGPPPVDCARLCPSPDPASFCNTGAPWNADLGQCVAPSLPPCQAFAAELVKIDDTHAEARCVEVPQ